jgi:hypothetical protein
MNNAQTLSFYTTLHFFRNNPKMTNATLEFPTMLTAAQRNTIHALADKLSLESKTLRTASNQYVAVAFPKTAHQTPGSSSFIAAAQDDRPQIPTVTVSNASTSTP